MTMKEFLAQKLPERITRAIAIGLSDDADARKNGETTVCNATFVFDTSWTVGDLIDRLMVANSPKVSFQTKYRGKDCPKTITWNVNKAGTRTVTVDPIAVYKQFLMDRGWSEEDAEKGAATLSKNPDMLKEHI